MLYKSTMTPPRKPKRSLRTRAKNARVPRRKIPDRTQVQVRVPRERLAALDAAVEARTKLDPSFTRTDATLEAWALWVAAESAKGGE